jgi:hypothetical protein
MEPADEALSASDERKSCSWDNAVRALAVLRML